MHRNSSPLSSLHYFVFEYCFRLQIQPVESYLRPVTSHLEMLGNKTYHILSKTLATFYRMFLPKKTQVFLNL